MKIRIRVSSASPLPVLRSAARKSLRLVAAVASGPSRVAMPALVKSARVKASLRAARRSGGSRASWVTCAFCPAALLLLATALLPPPHWGPFRVCTARKVPQSLAGLLLDPQRQEKTSDQEYADGDEDQWARRVVVAGARADGRRARAGREIGAGRERRNVGRERADQVHDAEAVLVIPPRRSLVGGGRLQAMDYFGGGEVRKPRPYESRRARNDRRGGTRPIASSITAVIEGGHDVDRGSREHDLRS